MMILSKRKRRFVHYLIHDKDSYVAISSVLNITEETAHKWDKKIFRAIAKDIVRHGDDGFEKWLRKTKERFNLTNRDCLDLINHASEINLPPSWVQDEADT